MSATTSCVTPPGVNSHAYYVDWLQELSELRQGGMVSDEDYAVSRAERLDALFNEPGQPWLKWLVVGLPVSLLIGVWKGWSPMFTGVIVMLCVLGAIAAHSRVRSEHLSLNARLDILRQLLERDLISSSEFAEFECRFLDAE